MLSLSLVHSKPNKNSFTINPITTKALTTQSKAYLEHINFIIIRFSLSKAINAKLYVRLDRFKTYHCNINNNSDLKSFTKTIQLGL